MFSLDAEQRLAVEAGPGELFISAGAGSGKTRVLTARFVSAVLGLPPYEPCDPGAVVAVTYTEKAAGELANRIRGALAAEGHAAEARRIGDAWISTIHGMCARILRQHAFEAGLDPQFSVLDDVESSALEASAFEEAASALAERDPEVVALFDAYGFAALASAARRMRADVRGLGLTVDRIRTIPAPESLDVLQHAVVAFRDHADGFDGLRQIKTVQGNAAAARSAADVLERAVAELPPAPEAVLHELGAVGFRRLAADDEHNGIVDAAKALHQQAMLALAQLGVATYEAAMLRLLGAFDARLEALKAERGALDFQDLQTATTHLLESHPDIADALRDRFAMIMVDEFQDTDELQLAIADRLARDNLCTVGDESQSIYSFRHADVEVFRRRSHDVERQVRLRSNYRTAPALLDAVNGLFESSALFGDRHTPLISPEPPSCRSPWPKGQPRFAVRFCDSTTFGDMAAKDAESECIAARVAELMAAGVEPGDIVVLLRALRGRVESLQQALGRRGIPVFFAAGGDFFECDEVVEARALLRVVNNVRDDTALVTVLRGRITGLSDDAMYALTAMADKNAGEASSREGRLWPVASAPLDEPALDPADRALLHRTVETVRWARRQRGLKPLGEIILQALLKLDVDLTLLASGPRGPRAWANLTKLVRLADEYDTTAGGDLGGLLDFLEMREEHATSEREATLEGETTAVRVMSIHAAKGLEFPVVIVGALDGGGRQGPVSMRRVGGVPLLGMRLPTEDGTLATSGSVYVREVEASIEAEEDVRLLYVACTRAEEGLTIVARTNPEKDSDASLGGLVRRALGMSPGATIESGDHVLGAGTARVDLVRTGAAMVAEVAPESPACEPPTMLPPEESASPPAFGAPRTVSYTGLSRYEDCPYSFYVTYVARMPEPPTDGGAGALSFGTAVHAVLERCAATPAVTADVLEAAALAAGLDRSELPRVRGVVERYLSSDTAKHVRAAQRVSHETPIAVPVGTVVLTGAIDVIGWTGSEAIVVDYKTGVGASSPDEAAERYRLQATCYGLAALAAGASAVHVIFADLESEQETAFEFTTTDQPALEAAVRTITDRMAAGDYAPRGTYEARSCERCPAFGSLCPVSRPPAGGAA